MSINCSRCGGDLHILNGMMQGKQRYKCKYCGCNFTIGDGRKKYENKVKLLAVKMYLNNCGFRRISAILGVPLATCFFWIKKAGKIVDKAVKERESEDNKPKLDFLLITIHLQGWWLWVCQIFCVSSSNHEALTLSDSVSSRIWNCCRASFQFLIGIVHFLAAFDKHKYLTDPVYFM